MATASEAFENPLIGNARMRAMYRALVECKVLAPHWGRARRLPNKLEACWVGTAIGLEPGDLTSDRRGDAALLHIRSVARLTTDGGPPRNTVKQLSEPAPPVLELGFERLLCAAGAAMALRSSGNGVVLAYAAADELSRSEWSRLLAVYTRADSQGVLPLVQVILPAAKASDFDPEKAALRAARTTKSASARRIPVLPVDAADAVALYRAAQESIGRARATGRAVVIECVSSKSDPIDSLRQQLIAKRIGTAAWCDRVLSSLPS